MRKNFIANALSLTYRNEVKVIVEDVHLEKRRKILEWLSVGDFSARHEELRKTRIKDSGRWFLDLEEFVNWVNGTGPSCLICTGIGINSFRMILFLIV